METPLSVIANVSKVVTKVIDRVMGDRVEVPLMVCGAVVHALKLNGIESRIMYGPVAWIEILEDNTPFWAGCWGDHFSFWVATQYGEIVDLNTSAAYRKEVHAKLGQNAIVSTPMIWSNEVPAFYRCKPEGVAVADPTDPKDIEKYQKILAEIEEKCAPRKPAEGVTATAAVPADVNEADFANEAIVCPNRRILDDSKNSFRIFDRALSVFGLPPPPKGISTKRDLIRL